MLGGRHRPRCYGGQDGVAALMTKLRWMVSWTKGMDDEAVVVRDDVLCVVARNQMVDDIVAMNQMDGVIARNQTVDGIAANWRGRWKMVRWVLDSWCGAGLRQVSILKLCRVSLVLSK